MLAASKVIGFVPTTDSKRARAFYEDRLGLEFVSDDPYALVMKTHGTMIRSEEHTSELQSHLNLVCRLLLEKKKQTNTNKANIAIRYTRNPLASSCWLWPMVA